MLGVKETNWEQLETVTPLNTKGFDQFVTVIEPVSNPKTATVFYTSDTSYNTAQKRLILKDWTSLEYAIKEPLLLIKNETPATTTTTTTEVIAKNNGSSNNTSKTTSNSNANAGSNSTVSTSAQKTLLINRKTGEVISVAELNERKRKRKNSKKGIQVSNGVGNSSNKGEILAAYPEFESFDGKQTKLGKQALTHLKFPHLRFAYKSAELSSQSQAYLENILALLKASPRSKLQIDAHTDHTGTWSSNMRLSAKRATVVKEFLTKNGINEERLRTKAYGEGKPLVWHVDTASHKKNRRVEVYFLK